MVDHEIRLLRELGLDVQTYVRSSDELGSMSGLGKASAAMSPLTGRSSRKDLLFLLDTFRPDVVHLHNPYPLISPRVIAWCRERRIPVVATIHNFRIRCMNGLLYRDGRVCTLCESSSTPLPGVIRGCYRDSHPQSVTMGLALQSHRKTWQGVTRFIAVSEFVADRLTSWGFDPSKIVIKPNPVDDPGAPSPPGRGYLFAGRLSQEKGLELLLDAWERSGLGTSDRLVIAGDGPLADLVRKKSDTGSGIQYVGTLSAHEVSQWRRNSAVGVLPSLWFEAHPAVAESFSHARPVVATRVGALPGIVDSKIGWLAEPSVGSLAETLQQASERAAIEERGQLARHRFETTYHSSVVIQKLIDIYHEAISVST